MKNLAWSVVVLLGVVSLVSLMEPTEQDLQNDAVRIRKEKNRRAQNAIRLYGEGILDEIHGEEEA